MGVRNEMCGHVVLAVLKLTKRGGRQLCRKLTKEQNGKAKMLAVEGCGQKPTVTSPQNLTCAATYRSEVSTVEASVWQERESLESLHEYTDHR